MMMSRALFAGLIALSLASCKEKAEKPATPVNPSRSLLIGLPPEQNIFNQVERYNPVAEFLSQKIGLSIKLTVFSQYSTMLDAFLDKGLDGAFLGSFAYALAHEKMGVEPLARPVGLNGESTYHGLIFVRKDSGITTIGAMKDKKFVFVDTATMAGYLLPRYFFSHSGIADYHTYFKETYSAGTHENAIYEVLNGRADIGAAKSTIFYRLAQSDRKLQELEVIATSPEMPDNVLGVRSDLNDNDRQQLKAALLGMHLDPEGAAVLQRFEATRFIETTDADYAEVYRYAREAGIDLAHFDLAANP